MIEVTFWGVRGAIPSPGAAFNRYGGNTPCVSLRTDDSSLVIFDAGTGIIVLGRQLMAEAFGKGEGTATLLLTHAHWDHIQGFPFFTPVHIAGNRFTIYGPSESPTLVQGILEGQMNPHFSPVQTLRNLGATIEFRATQGTAVDDGADGPRISACRLPHGRIEALAYRVEHQGKSVVYAPDAGYIGGEPSAEALALFDGADCLIHDCTYAPEDVAQRRDRGYASIASAAKAAARARVGQLVMFHYDQDYDDDRVDGLAKHCRALLDAEPDGSAVDLVAAAEGLTLSL